MKRNSENWPQIIAEVRAKYGLNYPSLGRVLGMSADGLRMIAIGRTDEPRYSVGNQLLFMLKGKDDQTTAA